MPRGKKTILNIQPLFTFSAFYGIHNFYLPLKMMRERERGEAGSTRCRYNNLECLFFSHLIIFKRHLIIKASVLFNVSLLTRNSSIQRVKVYYTDCVVCLFIFNFIFFERFLFSETIL